MSPGAAHRPHADQARLRELQRGTTISAALTFYDRLEPVGVEEMIGWWRGEGLPTGNPLDGLLERFDWYGKRFDGPDGAHPLECSDFIDTGLGCQVGQRSGLRLDRWAAAEQKDDGRRDVALHCQAADTAGTPVRSLRS